MSSGVDGLRYETRVVNVNWNAGNGGWNVNANSVTNPNRWNDGNQVFSRNCCVLPSSYFGAGVFDSSV